MPFWNERRVDDMTGMTAGIRMIPGGAGDPIHAYVSQPDGPGPYPGVVLTHHPSGVDEFMRETARRFSEHGFIAIVPNMLERFGPGTIDEVTAKARAEGGIADSAAVADAEAAMKWIKAQPNSNGKVGVTGPCAGGRYAVLTACSVPGFDAVVNLWGGGVVTSNVTERQPVPVIDLIPNLNMPMLGIFGNDDNGPSPAQVDALEAKLKEHGKTYMFHRYDGAGHGIWYQHDQRYRPQAAMDSWDKAITFFRENLGAAMM